jgi:hypothetical protein
MLRVWVFCSGSVVLGLWACSSTGASEPVTDASAQTSAAAADGSAGASAPVTGAPDSGSSGHQDLHSSSGGSGGCVQGPGVDCIGPCGNFVGCCEPIPEECETCPASATQCPGDCYAVRAQQLFSDGCLGIPETIGCTRRSQVPDAPPEPRCLRRSDGTLFTTTASTPAEVLAASEEWLECDAGDLASVDAGASCTHCGCDRGETTLECVCDSIGPGVLGCPTDPNVGMIEACEDPTVDWAALLIAPDRNELHVFKENTESVFFFDLEGSLRGAQIYGGRRCSDGTENTAFWAIWGGVVPVEHWPPTTGCIDVCVRRDLRLPPSECGMDAGLP